MPDPAQPDPHTPPVPPAPPASDDPGTVPASSPPPPCGPAGEPALAEHPLTVLHRQPGRVASQADLFAQLATAHDGPTAGHGWYWVGRAMQAAILAAGGEDQVRDLFAFTRAILRSWHTDASYGSDAPRRHRAPRSGPGPRPHPTPGPAPSAGERVSDAPILRAAHISGAQKQLWLERFRRADSAAAQRAVLERFALECPLPDAAAA